MVDKIKIRTYKRTEVVSYFCNYAIIRIITAYYTIIVTTVTRDCMAQVVRIPYGDDDDDCVDAAFV